MIEMPIPAGHRHGAQYFCLEIVNADLDAHDI
jgi:hypothetical protein